MNSLDEWNQRMIAKEETLKKGLVSAKISQPDSVKEWKAKAIETSKRREEAWSRGGDSKKNVARPYVNYDYDKCYALIEHKGPKTEEIITYQIDGDEASISRMTWHTEENDFNEAHSVHEVRLELSRNHWKNRVKQGYRVFAMDLWPQWLFRYFDNRIDEAQMTPHGESVVSV